MGKREILFRGKRVDNEEWAYGDLVKARDKTYIHPNANTFEVKKSGLSNCVVMREVIPETVGQYTGVRDESSKSIFEGDIVKSKCTKGEFTGFKIIGKVIFKNGAFGLYRNCFIAFDDSIISEVIGNLYDDPELLKNNRRQKMVNSESVLDAYRRDVAREILGKVFNAVEEVRLDCEFQDEKGNWLIDEGQFLGNFTFGKLFEIAEEYGVDLIKRDWLQEAEK